MTGHKTEDLKGRVKEAVGNITGNKGLQREGKIDRASAATKSTIDKATDKVKHVLNHKD
jgi:uncharacterized protein YjbJ (UPF0337 family)